MIEVNTNSKRWSVMNKNTGVTRTSKATRDEARAAKRKTEVIFDTKNLMFVR